MTLNVISIPEGWAPTSLEAVCHVRDSRRIPVNKDERSQRIAGKSVGDLYPYYGATGQVGLIDAFIFDGEHILLGEDGAPFLDPFKDKAYLVNGKFWVNNHAHILSSIISNKYVLHYLNQIDYSEHVTGTTRPKLTQGALRRLRIVVAPTDEQHRIVTKIEELFSELDKGVENLEKAREQLQIYRQAVLKHAFEGNLTARWREQNKDKLEAPEQLLTRIKQEREANYERQIKGRNAAVNEREENSKIGQKLPKPKKLVHIPPLAAEDMQILPKLPQGWSWLSLSAIAVSIQIGPFGSLLHKADYQVGGTPLVNPTHILSQRIKPDRNLTVSDEKLNQLSKYVMQQNDIVIGRRGEMGRCAVVTEAEAGWLCGTGSLFVRLLPSMNPHFYSWILSSQRVKDFLAASSIGTTMQNLNESILHRVPVPVCSPHEQDEVFRELEKQYSMLDDIEEIVDLEITKAATLRQSILKKAFSGQLVAQDPNDEPASVLLERIKAQKVAQSHSAKLRKERRRAKAAA